MTGMVTFIRANVRFDDLLTVEERKKLLDHNEQPVVTLRDGKIIVAFDRADHIYEFRVRREW